MIASLLTVIGAVVGHDGVNFLKLGISRSFYEKSDSIALFRIAVPDGNQGQSNRNEKSDAMFPLRLDVPRNPHRRKAATRYCPATGVPRASVSARPVKRAMRTSSNDISICCGNPLTTAQAAGVVERRCGCGIAAPAMRNIAVKAMNRFLTRLLVLGFRIRQLCHQKDQEDRGRS